MSDDNENLKNIIINTLISDDLEEAVRNITMELGKLFNADRVHFRFYDKDINTFSEVVEEYRKNKESPSSKRKMLYPIEFDRFLKDKLTQEKHLFIIDDINKPEYPETFKQLFENLEINNEIILPIFFRGELESAFFITNTESTELLSGKNLEFLIPAARQISIGTHLFKVQNSLIKAVSYEKILKEIIMEVRGYENLEQVFEYLVNKLADMYGVNKVLHLNTDSLGNFVVINEALKDRVKEFEGKIIFTQDSFKELENYTEHSIITVNTLEQIQNTKLKKFLEENNIKAFMLYPIEILSPVKGERKIEERVMVCSDIPRKWSYQDIESLKLIVGTTAIIYIEIRSRKEIRAIEEIFIASLVHDLKSPIYAEQKALEFIISKKQDASIQSIMTYLNDIYKTNEELLRLITNLLLVYSMDLGLHEIKKEPANISKIIDDAIRTIKPMADDNESEIIKNIQEILMDIYMDPDEIRRVFINIIINAIKHNPKKVEINISAEKRENEILISISDNGAGIPEAEKANIFQKYQTSKRKVGTGLGLYLSKQIVEYHGGTIWFESEEGKGTTFYFTLPLTDEIKGD
ncbi:MAG: GAF domain-containing sensor histidine kinase [bacterium]